VENIFSKKLYLISTILITIVALIVRLKYCFLGIGINCDEASLALNIISRSYIDLFKPLEGQQVAPPMFLVMSKFVYLFVNIHKNAYFSDFLLRIVPLFFGVISVPAFGFLLLKIFNNKLTSIFGMFLLTYNYSAISYSCIFKQYSTELFITILIFLICLGINFEKREYDKRNIVFSAILGLSTLFSMTALFIIPCALFLTIIRNFKFLKNKNVLQCLFILGVILLIYLSVFLNKILLVHYKFMENYWILYNRGIDINKFYTYISNILLRELPFSIIPYLKGFFAFSALLMLFKNWKYLLIILPIVITCLLVQYNYYFFAERAFIFLMPCILIQIIYPFNYVFSNLKNKYLKYIVAILLIIFFIIKFFALDNVFLRIENGRNVWEYYSNSVKEKHELIYAPAESSSHYYMQFYKHGIYHSHENFDKLKNGYYDIIITTYSPYTQRFIEACKTKGRIIEQKTFNNESIMWFDALYILYKKER